MVLLITGALSYQCLSDIEISKDFQIISCMNLAYHFFREYKHHLANSANTTLKQLYAAKLMHHTITKCMDNAPIDLKNVSFNNFLEGNPKFDYEYYFNKSYFINPNKLIKNHSLMVATNFENKYIESINRLQQKFKITLDKN